MRILLIADPMIAVPPTLYGGIERIIDMLCHQYIALGHEVAYMARPESTAPGKLIPLPGLKYNSPIDLARNSYTLTRQIWRWTPDIVHSFGRLVQLLPILPLSVPKVMSYQREPSLKGIARAHRLARNSSLLFTGCSDYIANQIATCANARTVYNGVPIERYQFNKSLQADAPLVFLGRVERIKGVHNAIQIAKEGGRRLIIAGNIPDGAEHQAYFELQIKPHLSQSIRYIGPVDDKQKSELLRNALALVMAIEWNEPFGIVMAEALACGTPVLGTRMGAVPEVVRDGITGFVRDSVDGLVDCIPKLGSLRRHDCREYCEASFSDRVIACKYLALYSSLQRSSS